MNKQSGTELIVKDTDSAQRKRYIRSKEEESHRQGSLISWEDLVGKK